MDCKRHTIQQQLIFNALEELNIHATAEQVFDYVVQRYPSISKATVYRNLNHMSEAGDLLKIGSFCGSTHYDHRRDKHQHFICKDCNRIIDVEGDFIHICSEIKDAGKFDINNFEIYFFGQCMDCKSK